MDSNNCSDKPSKVPADCDSVNAPRFKAFSFYVADDKPKTTKELDHIRLEGKFVIALAVLKEQGIKLKFTEDIEDMPAAAAKLMGGSGKRHTIKTNY